MTNQNSKYKTNQPNNQVSGALFINAMKQIVDQTLTDSQCSIYEAIRQAWLVAGHGPSHTELIQATGLSRTTVSMTHGVLRQKGYIHYKKHQERSGKPTNINAKIYNKQPDPWASLNETKIWES